MAERELRLGRLLVMRPTLPNHTSPVVFEHTGQPGAFEDVPVGTKVMIVSIGGVDGLRLALPAVATLTSNPHLGLTFPGGKHIPLHNRRVAAVLRVVYGEEDGLG